MTFGQSVSTCFGKYANFHGRASRSEFWWWQLFLFICYFGVAIIGGIITGFSLDPSDLDPADVTTVFSAFAPLWIVLCIFGLAVILPSLAVLFRRLHDSNKSGWWTLLYFIPWAAYVVLSGISLYQGGGDPSLADAGISLGLIFCYIACLAGGIVIFVFTLLPTQPQPNRYGQVPAGVYNNFNN